MICYIDCMSDPIPTAEQIIRALQSAGVPQRVIANKLAIPQSAVSGIMNRTRQLKLHEANILLSLLPHRLTAREVPIIGLAGAGNWVEAIEDATSFMPVPAMFGDAGLFAVEVTGQSMNLMLPEGSCALIDPQDRSLYNGKIYLLRNAEGEATIKRYRVDPSRFEPVSDDLTFVPFEVGAANFEVIGRVVSGHTKF